MHAEEQSPVSSLVLERKFSNKLLFSMSTLSTNYLHDTKIRGNYYFIYFHMTLVCLASGKLDHKS